MFQRKPRRFRRNSNGRGYLSRDNSNDSKRLGSNSFSNGQPLNNFRTPLSAEKLFEKYNTLAKEAVSIGDKTLSENYFQHADHFMRIIEDKNRKQNQSRAQINDEPAVDDKHLVKNSGVNQDKSLEEKKE